MAERMFVLLPLLEIDSEISLPKIGKLKDQIANLSWQKIERLHNSSLCNGPCETKPS